MDRGKTMFLNTILLTATSFLMRAVAMVFQVWLSRRIGAAGIGLFQLIMSVSAFAATFAISGIRFAATRLVSEELGCGNSGGVKAAVTRCLMYAFTFGSAALIILWNGANFIGTKWIGDTRTVLSLRLLALSLPALSMASVLSGYFTAVCRVIKSAAVQVIEQLIRISVVVISLTVSSSKSLEYACAIIVAGAIAGDISSFILQYILYLIDRRRYSGKTGNTKGLTKRMLGISLPLALSSYARSALGTLQNLLVPRGFKKSGISTESALSDYGMIQGMVFPVITFPSAFFYALAELLVPELTDAQMQGRRKIISDLVNRTLRLCLLFSLGVCAMLFRYSGELGMAAYDSLDVGYYIRVLALLMPIMYLDSVTDGMLRGLGQQIYSMKVNIADSVLSVALVYILLPKCALAGYIFMMYFTEIFNFSLSIYKLSKITEIHMSAKRMTGALFCAAGSVNITMLILRIFGLPLFPGPLSLTVHILLTLVIYLILLMLFRCIDKRDIAWFKELFKG